MLPIMAVSDPHAETPPESDILTLPEAAAYLRVDQGTLLDLVKRGMIPGMPVSESEWRFSKAGITEWLKRTYFIREAYFKDGIPWFHQVYAENWFAVMDHFVTLLSDSLKKLDVS